MKLLTKPTGNFKTEKNIKYGYLSYILHLSPSDRSGVMNTCPKATPGCKVACLNTTGHGGMFKPGETTNKIQDARIRRTKLFHEDKVEFFKQLISDIILAKKYTEKKRMKFSLRLNGTSDIVWEKYRMVDTGKTLFETFPDVQFYDYTKIPNRNPPSNYHLTFSRGESNQIDVLDAIEKAVNIAVVFAGKLPKIWNGWPVVSGDDNDLRFLDAPKHIIGLTAKGKAKKDTTGFVVNNTCA